MKPKEVVQKFVEAFNAAAAIANRTEAARPFIALALIRQSKRNIMRFRRIVLRLGSGDGRHYSG